MVKSVLEWTFKLLHANGPCASTEKCTQNKSALSEMLGGALDEL